MSLLRTSCALLLVCCAEGGTEEARSGDASKVGALLQEHAELSKELAAVPADARDECELSAGDCLVLVRERREKLVSAYGLSSCPAADTDPDDCYFRQLEGKGRQDAISELVTFKNWCTKEVLKCTRDAGVKARAKSVGERAAKRRQAVETAPAALDAWNAVESARQRVDYLRKTLPPKAGQGVCEMDQVAACQKDVEGKLKGLADLFVPDEFDQNQAVEAFAGVKRSQASCFDPEQKCLSDALNPYGMFPESRKLLESNFTLIAERQKLVTAATPEAEIACVSELEERKGSEIDTARQAYAREPVVFFRVKLEKTYIALHQAQIDCLKQRSAAPPAQPKVIDLD